MKYLILYGSAGHGHQRAAEYVSEELKKREQAVVLADFLAYTTPLCKVMYPWVYKVVVTKAPWLWGVGFHLTNLKCINWFIRPLRRVINTMHGKTLERFMIEQQPDVIVLTHFFPAEVAAALKRAGKISATVVTIVTDSIAHSTWVNRGTDFYIGMSEETKLALQAWGIAAEKILPFGIPIASKFGIQGKRKFYRDNYGLDQGCLTVLITSGSFGMGPTEKVLRHLEKYKDKVQVIVVCGNNTTLLKSLQSQQFLIKVKLFPFVAFIDELMEAADVVISKSGGLTMCESLAKELPMIISKPIPGQETYNALFLLTNDAAFRLRSPGDIENIIGALLNDTSILAQKKEHIRRIQKPQATNAIVDFLISLKP